MLPKVIFDDNIDGPYLFIDWQSYLTPIWIWFAFLLSILSNVIHILIIWHIFKSPLRMIDLILLGDQVYLF